MKRLKVLIIEDNDDDAYLLLRHLRDSFDVEFKRVDTADATRAALANETWEIILSDFRMPTFSAPEALSLAKELQPGIPFIIISGTIGEETAVKAMLAGADDFFIKGNLRRLVPAIERDLREAQIRREKREAEIRLRLAISAAGLGVWEWHLISNRAVWSPECYEVFGVDEFGETFEEFLQFIIPEDRERASLAAQEAIENHHQLNIEFRIRNARGDLRWLSNLGTVEYDAEGKPIRMIGTVQDITERKSAESLVRESEMNYRALIEASTSFTWTLDENGPAPDAFAWFSELSGRELRSIDDIVDTVHPDDLDSLQRKWQEAINNKSVFSTVARFRSAAGGFRFLAVRGVQVFNDDGSFRRWVGTLNDITERKSAEDELRRSEAFNRAVLDSMTSNIAVLDQNGCVRTLNRSWREFVLDNPGLPPESQLKVEIGANYPEAAAGDAPAHGEGSEEIAQGIRDVLNGKQGDYFEEYCVKISGVERWFYMLVSPLKTREGGAVVSHTDISSLKAAEEALKKHQAQLQLVADTVPTVVAHLDKNSRFLFVNDACRKWFQVIAEDEIIGHHMSEIVGEELYDRVRAEIDAVLTGKTIKVERNGFLDPTRYVYVTYVPDRDNENDINGYFFFLVDLTENKRAEERFRKSEEQLRQAQKLESIGRLAGGIAHDFNNMLTAIIGYCELTLIRMSNDDPLRRNIEEIKKAGERSAALTNQLLAFSRRQILEVKTLDVNRIVEDSIVMLQRVIGEDVNIRLDLAKDLWSIEGDHSQLTQVLLNLCVNSRDAMPRGGTITISTTNASLDQEFSLRHPGSRAGMFVHLAIADTGIGMDEETQRHIFEPFFTTKETGKGTGLGLSMVYGIVKQLGGYVWVISFPDGGTTFDIYLPKMEVETESEADNNSVEPVRVGSETILLVEDEDIVRELSRQVLESSGYKIIEASSGAAAIGIVNDAAASIDLLMTDVVMPGMSGQELAQRLAAIRPGLRVLFTSGYLDEPMSLLDSSGQDRHFIQKPFSFDQLVSKVRSILDTK